MPQKRKALILLIDAARRAESESVFAESSDPTLASAARLTMLAPSCWTVPSIASLLTGLFPSEHRHQWPLRLVSRPTRNLAHFLQDAGRSFYLVSANDVYTPPLVDLPKGTVRFPCQGHSRLGLGLRRTLGLLDYGGSEVTREVVQLAATGRLPDVLTVHLNEAHHPYIPVPSGLDLRRRLACAAEHLAYYARPGAQVWEFATRANDTDWERARARYIECLRYDVRLVEEILTAYREAGALDDTLVIISADHGEHLGEHGLADHQGSLHDQLVNVPCLLAGPGIDSGAEVVGQFQHTDVPHTVCRYLDVPMEGYEPAVAPLDMLDRANWTDGHEYAFAEWAAWGEEKLASLKRRNPSYDFEAINRNLAAVRTRQWKFIRGSDGWRALYNLVDDPGEQRDVLAENADVAATLEERLAAWEASVRRPDDDPDDSSYSDEDRELIEKRLADLGYI